MDMKTERFQGVKLGPITLSIVPHSRDGLIELDPATQETTHYLRFTHPDTREVVRRTVTLADKIAQNVEEYWLPLDEIHELTYHPVEHHELSAELGRLVIGGVEITHGECCPGRQDAVIFAATIEIGAKRV